MVLESVGRSVANGRPLLRGEVLLIGQVASGGLIRMRIPRLYRLFDALMVRGFIKQKALERLGIVIGGDSEEGNPKRILVALVSRADPVVERDTADRNLARLARAATEEWSGLRRPMLSVYGRPWPIALMIVVLVLDLVLGLERMGWVVAGYYSWLPMISPPSAELLYAMYLVLLATTAFALWRQMRFGYGLALTLAVVQLVRSIVLTIVSAQSATVESLVLYLAGAWLFPAFILLSLGMLYWERRQSP
jgi:hypothetical protein